MAFKKYVKNYSRKKRYTDVVEDLNQTNANNKPQAKDDTIQDGISAIAAKDLPKSSYAFKVDPYVAANQASIKYNWITAYNRRYAPSYQGKENIDGGYVTQYLTSNDSRLLELFDTISMEIGVNYRYLNMSRYVAGKYTESGGVGTLTPGSKTVKTKEADILNYPSGESDMTLWRGSQIIRKMYDAVSEAVSQLDATTFTYLAINTNYSVISSIEIPGVPKAATYYVAIDSSNVVETYCYTDVAAVILLMAIEYQNLLQSGLLTLKQINKLKNYEALMLKMNYNRETGPLNQLFGQLNKVAFAQLLTSIKLDTMGEYVDADWAKNTNLITQLISRRADDMIDPVMEISPSYNFSKVCLIMARSNSKFGTEANDPASGDVVFYDKLVDALVWSGTETIYDIRPGATPDEVPGHRCTNVITAVGAGGIKTIESMTMSQISTRINDLCGIRTTLAWARDTSGNVDSALTRYNQVVWCVEGVDRILTNLKTRFGDLRTVFDKLAPLGIVNYRKGIAVDPTDQYDLQPVDYMLVDDIYRTVLSGNTWVEFDSVTGRWTSYAMWNKHTGIPNYDAKSGGAFIAFCTKDFDLAHTVNTDVEYLPVAFTCKVHYSDTDYVGIKATNRKGVTILVSSSKVNGISNLGKVGSRLAVLPVFDTYDIKLPTVLSKNIIGITNYTSLSNVQKSMARFMIMDLTGMFTDSSDIDVDNALIAIYPYQIDPIEKSMLTYAKAFGPFKGVTDADANIGFAGISDLRATK